MVCHYSGMTTMNVIMANHKYPNWGVREESASTCHSMNIDI